MISSIIVTDEQSFKRRKTSNTLAPANGKSCKANTVQAEGTYTIHSAFSNAKIIPISYAVG